VVLVDHAAEYLPALYRRANRHDDRLVLIGWPLLPRLVRPVKNSDLWTRLDSATRKHQVQWFWVKGHAGHPENERADQLACQAAEEAAARLADNGWGPGVSEVYGSLLSQAMDEPRDRDSN
jgi:hypothetical protein